MGGNATDVSDFIRHEVEKMIAIAVVARGKDWAVDMKREKVKSFIEQKIQLLPSSQPATGVMKTVSIVYNGTKQAVHIPISHSSNETRYKSDVKSTKYGIEGGGETGAVVGKGEAGVNASAKAKANVEHEHTQSDIRKTNEEYRRGELDVGPAAHQKIFSESREFVMELTIRAHKKTKVVVHHLSEVKYGAKVGAAIGAVAGIVAGPVGSLFGSAFGAGAGAAVASAVTELDFLTLTAEEIFKANEKICTYHVDGDFVTLVLKHVYNASVEEAVVNPH